MIARCHVTLSGMWFGEAGLILMMQRLQRMSLKLTSLGLEVLQASTGAPTQAPFLVIKDNNSSVLTPVLHLGENGEYYFWIEALYVGSEDDADEEDYYSFERNIADVVHTDKITSSTKRTFDTFLDKLVAQQPESVSTTANVEMMPSVLLNSSATVNPQLSKDLTDMWVPRCYR